MKAAQAQMDQMQTHGVWNWGKPLELRSGVEVSVRACSGKPA